MRRLPVVLAFGLAACVCACDGGRDGAQRPEVSQGQVFEDSLLRVRVQSSARPEFVAGDARSRHAWAEARRFYAQNGYQLAWSHRGYRRSDVDALVRVLQVADQEGLDPHDYQADAVAAIPRSRMDATRAVEADLLATYAFLAYLARNNIEVLGPGDEGTVDPTTVDWTAVDASRLRFRQRPGKGNSLGQVKFVFPNHYNVYLHDTPTESLFNRIERDFSHGCVRVERPAELVQYVLRGQPSWTPERIAQAMNAGVERGVPLKQPLPIYLLYFTAWEERGNVHFRDDVYGYDHNAAE